MEKNIDNFMSELDRGIYADEQRNLVGRYFKFDEHGRSGDEAAAAAIEYAREVARLTVCEYHEWLTKR